MKQLQVALTEIQRGQIRPVYLIHGEETWLVGRSKRQLLAALEKTGSSLLRFAAESDVESVIGELQSLSLFAEHRTVVWQDCACLQRSAGEQQRKRLLEALDSGLEAATLVLTAEKVDRQSKLYRRITALGVELHWPQLPSYDLGNPQKDKLFPYVQAYLAEYGKQIRPDAFKELRERSAVDLWSVISELDRLIAYVAGQPAIERADVQALIPHTKTDLMFELIDAVGNRALGDVLSLLARLVESGTNALAIVAMLFQSLLQIRESRTLLDSGVDWRGGDYSSFQGQVLPAIRRLMPDSSLLAMHPYAAYKSFQRAPRFSAAELEHWIEGLADIDLQIKTSDEEGLRALQMFFVARLRGRP